jgi:DNA-binding response OmpR family regulator
VEPLWVNFDQDKLEKIFTNLLSNAFKFTPAGGEVLFSLEVGGSAQQCILKAYITDNGIGIPADQLQRIFDRFHQVDASATRSNEGTGIGLTLVKELVTLHDGKISVESVEGKGTTIQVILPLTIATEKESAAFIKVVQQRGVSLPEPSPTCAHALANDSPNSPTTQVLIVEDQTDLLHFISSQLSGQYKVLEAENGLKGLSLALDSIPDLIISDVMMPGLDGINLCHKLKTDERTSHIPIILLTAKADWESKLKGLETGADDYLTKPFKLEELQVRVRNVLENRRKIREQFNKQTHINPKEISVSSTDKRFLERVLSLLEENMGNADFDVDAFSKGIGLSRTHLHRKLTAITGEAPNELIRSIRLKRAAILLQQQHGNISEIAYAVGFNSLNYFTKCFKEYYGLTPSEYIRNSNLANVEEQ